MDIQVLNEIANLARQASLSKVSASVSANAQLNGLKGNPVSTPGNPATPAFEDSPEQIQAPVAPEISTVALAASAYSAVVGDGLNSDELNAIQDLAGKVRTAVSEFLSQPGLEQAENAAAVVASNPEAVQEFTSGVEQAVVAMLSLPATEGEVAVNAVTPNADLPEEVPAPEKLISLERITHGAEPNHSAQEVAASPALVHSRVSENKSIENPVAVEAGVETSNRDFTITAASPALQNAQAAGNARVETPASRPDAVASPQQEAVTRPATAPANPQEIPVIAVSPALQNAQAAGNARVETPVNTFAPSVNQGQGSEGAQAQPVKLEGATASLEGASRQAVSGQANPQPASAPQSGPAQSSGLFTQENAAVNPENIRNVNELVNAVVDNEFTSEAKKVFSEPKVIRTVADLADFILERLREIIASQQQHSQSSGEFGLS